MNSRTEDRVRQVRHLPWEWNIRMVLKKNNSQQLDRYHFYAIFKKVKINAKISKMNKIANFKIN